jgi:hypothetical protein
MMSQRESRLINRRRVQVEGEAGIVVSSTVMIITPRPAMLVPGSSLFSPQTFPSD